MRRHMDEDDETPAAPHRRATKAAAARHGFGSPMGMELTDVAGPEEEEIQQRNLLDQEDSPASGQNYNVQALADLESPPPPPPVLTMSSEESEETSPSLNLYRPTPPDASNANFANQLVGNTEYSPPMEDMPPSAVTRPPRWQNQPQPPSNPLRSWVSPTLSSASPSTTRHFTPSFRPSAFASPMAVQALRTPGAPRTGQSSVGSVDPIQMGTPSPTGNVVVMTPDYDDSASDSDSSVKERFSDQVKTLNTLLLSTGKRLGPLGHTSFSPLDKDNDDLTQEEEDLEEIRRQLQEELSMVDYSVLKSSPGSTPSRSSSIRSRHHFSEGGGGGERGFEFPDDEPSPIRSSPYSTPSRQSTGTGVATPQKAMASTDDEKPPKPSPKLQPPQRRNVLGSSPWNPFLSSSADKSQHSEVYLSSPSHSSISSSSVAMSPSSPPLATTTPPKQQQQQHKVTPPHPSTTRSPLVPVATPPTQQQRQQQQGRKVSPPTHVSSPKSAQQQQRTTASQERKVSASTFSAIRRQQQQQQQQQDAPTEVSHETTSSGSSGHSKSLLERFGFRKQATGETMQGITEAVNLVGGEREDDSSSSMVSMRSQDDIVSTSASEDSSSGMGDSSNRKDNKTLLSSSKNSTPSKESSGGGQRIQPVSAQAQTIRRLEEQLDSPEKYANASSKSPRVFRRQLAPEPPAADSSKVRVKQQQQQQQQTNQVQQNQPFEPPKIEHVGKLRAQGLLDSLDGLLFPSTGDAKSKIDNNNTPSIPKAATAQRSDTMSSIGTTSSLVFPSDEREFPRENLPPLYRNKGNLLPAAVPMPASTTVSMALQSSDELDFALQQQQSRPSPKVPATGRPKSQSWIGGGFLRPPKSGKRSSSQSSIGSSAFPTDERSSPNVSAVNGKKTNLEAKNSPHGKATNSGTQVATNSGTQVATTPETKNSKVKDTNWLLQTIGSIGSAGGETLSPIVHEDDDPERGNGISYSPSGSPSKMLFSEDDGTFVMDPVKSPASNSEGTGDKDNSTSFDKAARCSRRNFCCLLFAVFVGTAVVLGLLLSGVLNLRDPSTPSPTTSPMPTATPTIATPGPTVSASPSLSPTKTPAPTTPTPTGTPSSAPSPSPTIFTISFESVYQIVVRNGQTQDISPEDYESDLIESMNRLLQVVETNLNIARSGGTRRRLAEVLLPSTINRFQETACPQPNDRDQCEQVFAYITLQDAKNDWADFKLVLDLAIQTGQLQSELDSVNPESPVDIIDLIPDPPSPSPTILIPTVSLSPGPTTSPSYVGTAGPTDFNLMAFLAAQSFDGGQALMEPETPQHQAYLWLSNDAIGKNYTGDRLLQRYAMATFYYSTHGDDWFFKTLWLSGTDECLWYSRSPGLPCSRAGNLQNLELEYNNVNGQLPPELGLLSNSLERLVLSGGPVSFTEGTIPSELGYLTNLEIFVIRGNAYSGSIPTELGQWTAMSQFDVSTNSLTGPIPTELGRLGGLTLMDASANSLSGQIPTEIGNWERCLRFSVENNLLTGPIPSEIGLMRRLQSFHGGLNMLATLPTELGLLTFLDTLSLFENTIVGTIPGELSRMRRLIVLELSDNALTGPIPSQLGSLFDMRDRIDLSYNHLTGQIPTELGNLNRLRMLELQHNKLSGTIPDEFSLLIRTTTVRVDSNDLIGTIPLSVCTTFNRTFPAFYADCGEFLDNCPCCTSCCVDDEGCDCRYLGTPHEFLCYQQKKAL